MRSIWLARLWQVAAVLALLRPRSFARLFGTMALVLGITLSGTLLDARGAHASESEGSGGGEEEDDEPWDHKQTDGGGNGAGSDKDARDLPGITVTAPPNPEVDAPPKPMPTVGIGSLRGGSIGEGLVEPAFAVDNNEPANKCESTNSPVVITSGNKILNQLDFATATGEFALGRHYSKNKPTGNDGFGPGWTWSFADTLTLVPDPAFSPTCKPGTNEPGVPCPLANQRYQKIITQRADGRRYEYTYSSASGRYEDSRPESRSWIMAEFWSDSDWDSFTLFSESGLTEQYNGRGRIQSKRDLRNVGFTYSYYNNLPLNNGTMVSRITHTSGREISFTWEDNRIASITDPDNRVYSYGYNNGRLMLVTYPDGLGNITFHYEDDNHPDALTGYSVNGVRRTRYAYQTDGKVAWSGRENGVNRDHFVYGSDYTDVTNALGLTTRHNFETHQGIKRLASVSRSGSAACPSGTAFTYYDNRGYPSREVDFEGNQTFLAYNDRGELVEKRTGVGPAPGNSTVNQLRTTYGWDTDRNLLLRKSRYGSDSSIQAETRYTYYPDSDTARARALQKVERCAPACSSGQKRVTTYSYTFYSNNMPNTVVIDGPLPGNDDAVTYQYDTAGNLVSATNGLGHSTAYSNHDGSGRPGRVVGPNGDVTEYAYDARGRVTESTAIVNGVAQTTTHTYDAAGQLRTTTTPDNVTLTREYDAVGRVTREYQNEPGGTFAVKRYTYNNASQVTSVKVQRTTAVVKPSGTPSVSISGGASGNYTVSWSSSDGVENYRLQEKFNGGSWSSSNQGVSTSKAFSNRAAGTYAYRVRACNAEGCTAYSSEKSVEVVYPPTGVPTLTAPTADNDGAFTLSWTGVSAATRYQLQQRKNGGAWSTIYNSSNLSKAVSGLTNGSYDYRVRACNAGGCAAFTAIKTTVVTYPPTGVPTLTAPATDNNGAFTLSWTSVSAATRYQLQQRENSGAWSNIYNNSGLSKAVSGLGNGTYDYRVRACNVGGCAAFSAIKTTVVTHPPGSAPTVSTPSADNNGAFSVTWTAVSTATSYRLIQRKNGGSWSQIYSGSGRSKSVSGLGNGTYEYRARACNAGGCGSYSPIKATVVTHPPGSAPTVSAPSADNNGAFSVTWTAVSTATSYRLIQRKNGGSWSQIYSGSGRSKSVSGLGNGTYEYRARACNAGGCGSYSSIKTTVVTHPPGSAPTLNAPSSTGSGYHFTWTSVSTATRYKLEHNQNGGSNWYVVYNDAGTSKTVNGVDGENKYRVRACNAGGCGPYSNIRTVWVYNDPDPCPPGEICYDPEGDDPKEEDQ